MTHRPLVFLDIETTGGSPVDSRITEIGAVRVENGEVAGSFSQLLNPGQPVPYYITKLTGISDDMLWDQPAFHGVADELEYFLREAIFVAHNVNFDYSFIKEEFRRMGGRFNMDRFCTVRLSRQLYPAQRRHNLDTVIQAHGLTVANRHRALDDATVLHEFYKKALQEHGLQLYAAINKIMVRSNAAAL
jgi:DNA polymerase III subunit epsilon